MKILLIEDDQSTGELLSQTLINHHYTVDVATDGQTGLELAILWDYALIVLDVQLPGLDGISLCRQLRSRGDTTPILILTAQDSEEDVINGLDAGADDYVAKPCHPLQLLARIRALLRRVGRGTPSPLLTWGDLQLDPASAQVTYQQRPITLRPKEYNLLELFLRHPQRVFSRNAILDHLWTIDDCPTEHAVTNLIKDLRRQLKAAGMTDELIETLYGLGYRLRIPPTAAWIEGKPSASEEPSTSLKPLRKGLAMINQITEEFKASLHERITRFDEMIQALHGGELADSELCQQVRQEAHRLAGSLGTFGYTQGSELARAIEHLVIQDGTLQAQQLFQIQERLTELKLDIKKHATVAVQSKRENHSPSISSSVLLIAEDDDFANELSQVAMGWNLHLEIANDLVRAWSILDTEPPVAILLALSPDTSSDISSADRFSVLTQLKQQYAAIPVLVLAEHDNLDDRVQVARLGGERYLSKPIAPAQVLEAITQLLPQATQLPDAKVLIVDDDPVILTVLANLLTPWGIQATCLSHPSQFWEILTTTQPDLLLLDLEMPTFNGIELCQVVRQDPKYGDLPILVVTAHTDRISMQRVFAAGADDLIAKPIVGPELVTRVISRIERSRLRQQLTHLRQQQSQIWQQQATVDPLTQVANRRFFDDYLHQQWQHLLHIQEPLSLILCDIDEFKSYNDRYGHPAGDWCLQQIASAIQSCLKLSTDRVARYGGEEFGVILPNTNLNGALNIAERIQHTIAQLQLPHDCSTVSPYVTLSIGITGTIPTPDQSLDNLIATADKALYAAKRKSRNTYCLYPL